MRGVIYLTVCLLLVFAVGCSLLKDGIEIDKAKIAELKGKAEAYYAQGKVLYARAEAAVIQAQEIVGRIVDEKRAPTDEEIAALTALAAVKDGLVQDARQLIADIAQLYEDAKGIITIDDSEHFSVLAILEAILKLLA